MPATGAGGVTGCRGGAGDVAGVAGRAGGITEHGGEDEGSRTSSESSKLICTLSGSGASIFCSSVLTLRSTESLELPGKMHLLN